MAGPIIALLLSIQTPVLLPDAPAAPQPRHVPPGMAYDPMADRVLPIRDGEREAVNGLPAAGTRLRYNRLGQKVGEAPVRR